MVSKIINTDIENNMLSIYKYAFPKKINFTIHHKEKQENTQTLYGKYHIINFNIQRFRDDFKIDEKICMSLNNY